MHFCWNGKTASLVIRLQSNAIHGEQVEREQTFPKEKIHQQYDLMAILRQTLTAREPLPNRNFARQNYTIFSRAFSFFF